MRQSAIAGAVIVVIELKGTRVAMHGLTASST
jgi:hypothetical protein